MSATGLAIIGCGFVADYYLSSLNAFPELAVVGAYDRDSRRLGRFAEFHGLPARNSADELLDDPRVDMVVNLTSPVSHVEVTCAALEAGKHVYSEKPLALTNVDAAATVEHSRRRGRLLSGAPCCLLGETAQTMWREIRRGSVGAVRFVRVTVNDGLLHRSPVGLWRSASGAPWPARDEVRLGCVGAHAAYGLSWLTMMFGPVREIAGLSGRMVPPEAMGLVDNDCGPDVAVAALRLESGLLAQISCGTVSPRERAFAVYGDEGILETGDCSDDRSPVHLRRYARMRRRLVLSPLRRRVRLLESGVGPVRYRGAQRRHFARGIDEMANSIRHGKPPRLTSDFLLHVNEVVLALRDAGLTPHLSINSSFAPIAPMDWAADP